MLATVDLLGGLVDADLDTLATARYVTIDELLQRAPQLAPWRPTVGMAPKLSDAELVTLAVMQALLGFSSQACWLRYADRHLRTCSPICPARRATPSAWSGGAAATARHPGDRHRPQPVDRRCLAGRLHPLECGRSQETTKRSALAGWAQYGSCASHSRSVGGCGCSWSAPCMAWRSGSR